MKTLGLNLNSIKCTVFQGSKNKFLHRIRGKKADGFMYCITKNQAPEIGSAETITIKAVLF